VQASNFEGYRDYLAQTLEKEKSFFEQSEVIDSAGEENPAIFYPRFQSQSSS
jgi:hypothetical protein